MRIALVGSRGIPACYSGFETFYENLAVRLAAKGYDVTVYNRAPYIAYRERAYRGVRLVRLPTIRTKHLDTLVHTLLSLLHAVTQRYDIVYVVIVGNSPLAWLPRLAGARTLLNVDGHDWQRAKWGLLARAYLRLCERLAVWLPDVVIADSRVMQERYRSLYGADAVHIPYGAPVTRSDRTDLVARFGLTPSDYILFVGRLVPENAADLLVEAYARLDTRKRLVIVGDAPYSAAYQAALKARAGPGVRFTGYVFGEEYAALSSHAYLFVLPSAIDGTRPVLLDQMGFGSCCVVRDTPGNLEVLGDAGVSFDGRGGAAALAQVLARLLERPDDVRAYGARAQARVAAHYSWDAVTDSYIALFMRLCHAGR